MRVIGREPPSNGIRLLDLLNHSTFVPIQYCGTLQVCMCIIAPKIVLADVRLCSDLQRIFGQGILQGPGRKVVCSVGCIRFDGAV